MANVPGNPPSGGKGKPGMVFEGRNLKVPVKTNKMNVNAGRVIKTPPKPSGSGGSK